MENQVVLSNDNQQSEKSVIIYRSEDGTIQLEVELYNETVWLTRPQMALLFNTTPQNVTMHIGNIYTEEELTEDATSKDFLLVQNEGGRNIKRRAKFYNLDVIISVGYRVKSKRGTQFRKWANNVLKDYLLKGHAVNNRLDRLEVKVYKLEEKTNAIDSEIHNQLPPHEGIFYDGQIFDAYSFISDLIRMAKKEIILIDNYIDDSVLKILNKRVDNVTATIYTSHISENLKLDLDKHNSQYQPIYIERFNKSHDRFLIIDNDVYLIGASIKDLGKKVSTFIKLSIQKEEFLQYVRIP